MKLTKHVFSTLLAASVSLGLAVAQNTGTAGSQAGSPAGANDQHRTGSTSTDKMPGATKEHSGHIAGAAGTSGSASMVGKNDEAFMKKAAMGGMTEVQLAQMAQQKAASQEVKDYARKLEQDHSQANDKLKAIAQERQVQLPTDIGPEHQKMVSRLNNLSGEEFDRAYIRMMLQDHRKDIGEFQKEANRGMDTDLKEFASSTLPTLQEHLRMTEQLNGSTRSRKADKNATKSSSSTNNTSSDTSSSSSNSSDTHSKSKSK